MNRVLEHNPLLQNICNNPFFMMRQLSDAVEQNVFDHIVFVDTELITDVLERENPLVANSNDCVEDKYTQMFLSEEIYTKHTRIFKDQVEQGIYKVIPSYDNLFNGFVRTENYFIMLNSTIIDKFPVFVLINSVEQNIKMKKSEEIIEFYGLKLIGYLINPAPYTTEQIQRFETEKEFTIPPRIKEMLITQPIIKYNNKLYYVDLFDTNSSLMNRFQKRVKNINNVTQLKNITNALSYEERDEAIVENDLIVSQMCDGFLYLGLISKISIPHKNIVVAKQSNKLYLLLNFEEQSGVDYSFTLWERIVINNNVDKMLKLYTDKEITKNLKTLRKAESLIDINDPQFILHAMKFISDG